jgi:DNA-binding NarL/FixJ family response regulator
LSSVRVFVVDDHAQFRSAVSAIIGETEGFVVVGSAESGEQSLELIPTARADLVLMDVNLPGISGIEAARRLAASQPAPMVVLLSTYDEGELDYSGSGVAAYLNKSAFSAHHLTAVWASCGDGDGHPDRQD